MKRMLVPPVYRKASQSEAKPLAKLMNMAGEGLPAYLWAQMGEPGADVFDTGASRVARPVGGFSFTHAHVALLDGQLAGMLLGYRLADPYALGSLEEVPQVVRPLIELESLAPGSWYINAIATFAEFRGCGVGTGLMQLAEELAAREGCAEMSLIVAAENVRAKHLYEKLGYEVRATRPIVPFEGCEHGGDWVLMLKDVVSH